MRKPRRIGNDGQPHHGTAHDRRPLKRAVWDSRAYRKSRRLVFYRDDYICRFCGVNTIPMHPRLKPTADHFPMTVQELLDAGIDPSDPDTMVTACAKCHGRRDAERQHA